MVRHESLDLSDAVSAAAASRVIYAGGAAARQSHVSCRRAPAPLCPTDAPAHAARQGDVGRVTQSVADLSLTATTVGHGVAPGSQAHGDARRTTPSRALAPPSPQPATHTLNHPPQPAAPMPRHTPAGATSSQSTRARRKDDSSSLATSRLLQEHGNTAIAESASGVARSASPESSSKLGARLLNTHS